METRHDPAVDSVEEVEDRNSSGEEATEKQKGLDASAKAVFRTLNPEGKREIAWDDVLKRIKSVPDANKKERANKKHVENVVRKLLKQKGERGLSEQDMKKLNRRFMNGHLPRLKQKRRGKDSDYDEDKEEDADFEERKPGMTKRMLRHGFTTARTIWRYAEKSVSRAGRSWMWTLLPTGQISTLITFMLYSYIIKASFLAWFIPLVTLTISMCIMLVSSIRLVRGMKRFAEFKAWADFLDSVQALEEKAIDTGHAEESYILKHVSPYIHFFIATAFCVMGYSTSDKAWLLNAELGILSCLMWGTIVYIHDFHKSKTSLAMFGVQILGSVLRGFYCGDGSEVLGFITSIWIPFTNISLNLSLPSVLRVMLILLIVYLALSCPPGQKVRVYSVKVLFPHIVALAWWDIADMFFCFSSYSAIARASTEYLVLFFAMPAFMLFLVYTLVTSIFSLELSKLSITVAVIVATALYFAVLKKKSSFFERVNKTLERASLKKIFGGTAILILGYIMISYRPSGLKVPKSNLAWEDYRDLCLKNTNPSLAGNDIAMAALCYEFKGYGVTWDGTIEKIGVVRIQNKVEDLLNLLPHSAANWLSCMHGDPYPNEKECQKLDQLSATEKSLCSISQVVKRPCHIQNHNIYTFKITVAMPGDDATHLALDVSHDFYELVSNLKSGSALRFTGTITDDPTRIAAKVLFDTTDRDKIKSSERHQKRIEKTLGNMLDQAFDALWDFIFYPILSFSEADASE